MALAAAENDLVEKQSENRQQRPEKVLTQMRLPPAEFSKLEFDARPQIRKRLKQSTLLGFGVNPGRRSSIEILPQFFFGVPNQAPGVGIALTHDIFFAGILMNRI